jgi:hypothetical protein
MAGTAVYLFGIGLTSSASMALVLGTVRAVGKSGSLRYSMLSALSYLPIEYMSWVEGRAARTFGFRAVPMMAAISSLLDLPLLLAWLVWRGRASTPRADSAVPSRPARSRARSGSSNIFAICILM